MWLMRKTRLWPCNTGLVEILDGGRRVPRDGGFEVFLNDDLEE